MFNANQECVLEDIRLERAAQDKKWGEQNHDPFTWMTVLMEEVGEASQEMLRRQFGGKRSYDLRQELVQVAAVATAMIECCDRNGWCE